MPIAVHAAHERPTAVTSGRALWDARASHRDDPYLTTADGHDLRCILRAECVCLIATELPDIDCQL